MWGLEKSCPHMVILEHQRHDSVTAVRLFLCVPAWLGLWPRSVVSIRARRTAWLSKKRYEEVVLVCKSHSQKALLMIFAGLFVCFCLFFFFFLVLSSSYFPTPPSLFFCTRKYQEQFIRRSCPATRAMSQVCRNKRGTEVRSLQGLCRQPSTCSLQSDIVGLVTKNPKYCRCGVADLPGPLSHVPKCGTAG